MGYVEFGPGLRDLLYTTVRIETVLLDGTGAGTGFLFSCTWHGHELTFLVTNKHVIAGAQTGSFIFTESDGTKLLVGQRVDVTLDGFEARWHPHPDPDVDIAVMPINVVWDELGKTGRMPYYKTIPEDVIPSVDLLSKLDIFSDVLFIGYPNGMFDRINLVPITRQGMTATPPNLDYDGRPVVLIDASVFPGSSGSPVFILQSGIVASAIPNGASLDLGRRLYFLGIIAEVAIREERGTIDFVSVPTVVVPVPVVNQMIDLGVVYRSSEVLRAVNDYLDLPGRVPHQPRFVHDKG